MDRSFGSTFILWVSAEYGKEIQSKFLNIRSRIVSFHVCTASNFEGQRENCEFNWIILLDGFDGFKETIVNSIGSFHWMVWMASRSGL
jgi:hypothetical protein